MLDTSHPLTSQRSRNIVSAKTTCSVMVNAADVAVATLVAEVVVVMEEAAMAEAEEETEEVQAVMVVVATETAMEIDAPWTTRIRVEIVRLPVVTMLRKVAIAAAVDEEMVAVETKVQRAKNPSKMEATLAAMASAEDRLRLVAMMEASTWVARVSVSDEAAPVDLVLMTEAAEEVVEEVVLTTEADKAMPHTTVMVVSSSVVEAAAAVVAVVVEEMEAITLIVTKEPINAIDLSDLCFQSRFLQLKICQAHSL